MLRRLSAILASAIFALSAIAADRPASERKPNIVVILADDLSYGDLGCFGQKNFVTPNIDRLAAEGMVFTNAYAGAPWCAPSRTALLTGRHVGHPAPKDGRGQATFNPTVAQLLKSAGYATCAIGKWHMQEPGGTSWIHGAKTDAEARSKEVPASMPWNRGFDVCRIGYSYGLNPYYPHQIETGNATEIALPENKDVDDDYMSKNYRLAKMYDADGRFLDKAGQDSTHFRYAEDLYRQEAVTFLRGNKDRPFFLYYATPLMHGPLAVKELGEFKEKPAPWTPPHKVWAAEARELDRSVGILIDQLHALGLEKDTIVLFASDNGYAEWGYFGRANWTDDPVFHNKGPCYLSE
jgi:arylsulfatase A-like enzyme